MDKKKRQVIVSTPTFRLSPWYFSLLLTAQSVVLETARIYIRLALTFLCLCLDQCEADGNASSSWIPLNSPACLIIWLLWQPAPCFKITSTCSERPPPPEHYRSTPLLREKEMHSLQLCSHLTARMNNVLRVYMSTEWAIINTWAMHLCEASISLKLLLVSDSRKAHIGGGKKRWEVCERIWGRVEEGRKKVKEAEKEYDGKIRWWRKRRSKVKQMSEQLAQEMGWYREKWMVKERMNDVWHFWGSEGSER